MRLLLDTHILIWWLSDHPNLSAPARAAIASGDNDVFVSAASIWEISIKRALGRIAFPLEQIDMILSQSGFSALPIQISHAVQASGLPPHHQDPFDRLLIAQAQCDNLTLLSVDETIARYAVPLCKI